jgi:hypothetical protein
MNANKVYWTEDEKRTIVARAIEIRQTRLFDSSLHIFREAMKALPLSRRRRVRSIGEVPWFERILNEELAARSQVRVNEDAVLAVMQRWYPSYERLLGEIVVAVRENTQLIRKLTNGGLPPAFMLDLRSIAAQPNGATTHNGAALPLSISMPAEATPAHNARGTDKSS